MHSLKGKRRASSTEPVEDSKRIQKDARDCDGPDSQSTPTALSRFFCLPRELRDHIYELILETTPTTFKHGYLTLLATVGFPSTVEVSRTGLPPWIRSNRQMCSEAVQVFGRTRTFMAISLLQSKWQYALNERWRRSYLMWNPLVVNWKVIQNIAVVRGYSVKSGLGDWRASVHFLDLLKRWEVNDLCLETRWFRRSFSPYWNWENELFMTSAGSDMFWNGRFRKVKIDIQYAEAPGSTSQKMLQWAELCARRLVRQGGVVAVEDRGRTSEYAIDTRMRSGA